ncbi:MAG: hypothetical protein ACYC0X_18380 [Pirellulaceae bacterium]
MRNALFRHGVPRLQPLMRLTGWRGEILVTPSAWRVQIARWLVAVVVLTVTYQAYALLVVPWIEPGPGAGRAPWDTEAPIAGDAHPEFAELFPEGAWERGRPMVLTTQWGKLLFKEYRPSNDGRLELVPCTIIFYTPKRTDKVGGGRRAIIMQAPDKAVLSFAGPLNLVRAEFTKLQGARLEGQVRITSQESAPGANDALRIETRNVQILPRQIWTAHEVTFAYGPNHGSGRDLSITLSPTGGRSPAPGGDALARNLETFELAHVDKLVLHVPADGLLGNLQATPSTRAPVDAAAAAPPRSSEVNVTCQGPFRFDFQKSVASLEDRVDIVRDNPDGHGDQLNCDRLQIYFDPPAASSAARATGAAPASADPDIVRKLAVRRIEAQGFPVTLQAPSVAVTARGQQLSYDFQTRRILLVDDQNALLVYRQHRTEAPKLEYELHTDPQRLGRLWAGGPGSYQGEFGQGTGQALTANWRGTLELQPQDGQHVLSVVQGADLKWNETSSFAADELYVWLAEVPVGDPAAADATPAADRPAGERASTQPATAQPGLPSAIAPSLPAPSPQRLAIRPVKMLAQGNVRADSQQFQGQTPRLEIWFDQPESGPGGQAGLPAAPLPGMPQPAPAAARAPEPPSNNSDNKLKLTSDNKLELTGDWIRLRLLMISTQPKMREATIIGKVRLAQVSSVPGTLPLMITGEMLQLRTDPLDRSEVDVNGTPARVHAQGMLLEGANLRLSQRENRLEAEGPGRMKLPAQTARRAHAIPPGGPPPLQTPLWIHWQGGMDFDGQLIRFERQVEVRGIHTGRQAERMHVVANGDQLHALLNRYVAFEKSGNSNDLDVVELRFLGDVLTDNQTFNGQDVLTSRDRMKTRDMTLDRRTGRFHAAGPGWFTSTRFDTGGLSGSLPTVSPPTTPVPPAGRGRLVYLRVDYENEIEGNIDKREAVLQHRVRTVYGPVLAWDQTIDPDQRGGLGPHGLVMTSQRLFITEMGEEPERGVELSAVGNTLVEGAMFTARAQRLSYVQAKDQLMLDGENGLAQLQQQRQPGERPTVFRARQIKYWVGTGEIDVLDAQQLDYTHVGSPDVPGARIR